MNISITVNCEKGAVLARLKANREQHARLVKEAREGYVEQAKVALAEKLNALASGKLVSLAFALQVPRDYTSQYDTVIAMLEAHTDGHVELEAREFRQFMEDKWDWRDQWIGSNKFYSSGTAALEEDA
jgi:predicted exporter